MADLPTNLAILTGAGLGSLIAPLIPNERARAVLTIGAGVVGLIVGLDIALTAKKEIEELGTKWTDAVKSAAQMPFGSGSLFEQGLGAFGRAAGMGPNPGASSVKDRPATEGAKLGPPTNALRIAGVIRTVENQEPTGSVGVPIFADTVLVDVALENQSTIPRSGTLLLEFEQRASHASFVPTRVDKAMTLAPGEFRQVTMRVGREQGFAFIESALRLSWEGYTLDRATFTLV